ncbi:hypothetical protein AKJ09_10998 [Labilithrix luteola]|uniref:TIR domain-containing protein n=1 Tax=Labilithrix luteola TaxID=1391654 RepID=A0A0K1QFY9_9BACT|nr:hypothetical protein AKJ09_10998 [Labilithrix luteola]
MKSQWVEREWHDNYWDEMSTGKINVLPLLLEDCEIPRLLRTKKYADFRADYSHGLDQLLRALHRAPRRV